MGRSQRDKGARGERSLVMHLNLLGFKASRVIRTRQVRGLAEEIVPDVIAQIDGQEETFESKVRGEGFEAIYRMYEKEQVGNVHRFTICSAGPYVAMGTDLLEVRKSQDVHFRNILLDDKRKMRTYEKVVRMRKLLKGAKILAIRGDRKPWLFIKYWA